VDGVSLELERGRVLALVGESGSGKSVTGLALTRLLPDSSQCRVSGRIHFRGHDLTALSSKAIRAWRGRIAYVFQETGSALNPVFSVGYQIAEAVRLHQPGVRDVRAEVVRALDLVGIENPEQRAESYPHQLSGGMQQRAMIAMALACRPELLVADEPTTGLDVTIQAQIVELLRDLQQRLGMAVLLITHDFGVVSGFADRVAVMRQGRIVERGETERILREPRHPYTRALIACIPVLGSRKHRLPTIDSSQ
jgi:ABC-type dipeptide/oligopeptide/nickel transport system ATPase component